MKTSKAKPTKMKRSFRERIGLGQYITMSVAFNILIAGGVISTLCFQALYFHKSRDTWAILFLELDKQAGNVRDFLAREHNETQARSFSTAEIKVGHLTTLQGPHRIHASLADLGIDGVKDLKATSLLTVNGRLFVTEHVEGNKFLVRGTNIRRLLNGLKNSAHDTVIYAATRQGKLVYSSSRDISSESLTRRPLVQSFISVPLREGQLELTDKLGNKVFGFFKEIDGTNLVLFGETPVKTVVSEVFAVVQKLLMTIGGILLIAVLAIQLPLFRITKPIKELVQLSKAIAAGNFNIKANEKSYGELGTLLTAFSTMARDLALRDQALSKMHEENRVKERLEREMETAKSIQTNLLPNRQSMGAPGVEASGVYVPADECAGDWFSQYFDPERQRYYVAIADVSGHGAGASMFTTVIATVFHEAFRQSKFDIKEILASINASFHSFGKRKWHASIQVLEIDLKTLKATLHNAGHLPPLWSKRGEDGGILVKKIMAPSTIVGIADQLQTASKTVQLQRGDVLLLMTDGLTEARNTEGKMFGAPGVRKFLEQQGQPSAERLLSNLTVDLKSFMAGAKLEDDVCILALRVA